ncbi:MAG: hypothetical protein Q9166_007845 [cf. Caloplaca sp. 2 TL-2023]
MAMTPYSLASLPPELLCRIFKSADDFSVVSALSRTAHIFIDVWRANSSQIYEVVAPRVFSNLTDVERLINVQEEAEALKQLQSRQHGCDGAGFRVKRLLFNARCASAAYSNWVSVCAIHHYPDRGENPYMRPSERGRFERAFYLVWTIGVMARPKLLQNQASTFLDTCSPRELCRLNEMSTWIEYYNENDLSSLGLDFHDETWKVGCDLVSKHWIAYLKIGNHSITVPDCTPFTFFAFFDNTQDYLGQIPDHW